MDTNKELSREKAFESKMAHCEYIRDWSEISSQKLENWQLNMLVDYLSDIAHDRVMEEISYEDFLTEDEAELYRKALGINDTHD
jgi:hypothetical protein